MLIVSLGLLYLLVGDRREHGGDSELCALYVVSFVSSLNRVSTAADHFIT